MKKNIIYASCLGLGLAFQAFIGINSLKAVTWWSDQLTIINKTGKAYHLSVNQEDNWIWHTCLSKWTNMPNPSGVYAPNDSSPHAIIAKIDDDCETAIFNVYVWEPSKDGKSGKNVNAYQTKSYRTNPGHHRTCTLYYDLPKCAKGKYCCL